MSGKRVLMINLGWEQLPLASALISRGCSIYGIHDSHPVAYDQIPLAGLRICDLRDLEAILQYAVQVSPDAVVSDQCDYSMFAQAVVAEHLDLPGPTVRQAQVATNKLHQRAAARDAGLLIPEFECVTSAREAIDAAGRIGYPVIFKPVDNRGSFGVCKVSGEADVNACFLQALLNSHSRLVLVERFIHGVQITVDGYAFPESGCRSLTCATKQLLDDDRQVAMDIIYPGEMSEELRRKAMRVNEDVNRLLGFDFGMTHSEYMVTPDEDVYLIESANRGGGCFTSELIVPAHSRVDVLQQLVSDVLGEAEDLYREPATDGVLLKFFRFDPGTIRAIHGVAELLAAPGVLAFRLSVGPGDVLHPITTDGNRHGFLILKNDGPAIRKVAEDLMEHIQVDYV